MTDQERQEMIQEARIFALARPIILPLLEKRKKVAFERLMLAHKEGKTENVALVAELSVLSDLEREINQKDAFYNSMTEKQR